uniref:Putative secreted protein n=1 Tax=Panstrongylus lignarius TaxID=156445 RepID=A0A224XQS5_9HEMI
MIVIVWSHCLSLLLFSPLSLLPCQHAPPPCATNSSFPAHAYYLFFLPSHSLFLLRSFPANLQRTLHHLQKPFHFHTSPNQHSSPLHPPRQPAKREQETMN